MKRIAVALITTFPFIGGACMAGMCGMGHDTHATDSHASELKAPKE